MNGFRPSTVRHLLLTRAELEKVKKKESVEMWIAQSVAGDAALGRTGACFGVDPHDYVTQEDRRALKARGIVCYSGSGNYFQADLTGTHPRVIQRRPLAQRFVELIPGASA